MDPTFFWVALLTTWAGGCWLAHLIDGLRADITRLESRR